MFDPKSNASRLSIAVSLALTIMIDDVKAGDQPEVRSGNHTGFGRMVLSWDGPVTFDKQYTETSLILRFNRSIPPGLYEAADELPGYLEGIVRDDRSDSVRFVLLKGIVADIWSNGGNEIVVDFSEKPRSDLSLRAGRHGDFDRIVFDWNSEVGFESEIHDNTILVTFDRVAPIDANFLEKNLPDAAYEIVTGTGQHSSWLKLRLREPAEAVVSSQSEDTKVVIDIRHASAPVPKLKPIWREAKRGHPDAVGRTQLMGTRAALSIAETEDGSSWVSSLLMAGVRAVTVLEGVAEYVGHVKALLVSFIEESVFRPTVAPGRPAEISAKDAPRSVGGELVPGPILAGELRQAVFFSAEPDRGPDRERPTQQSEVGGGGRVAQNVARRALPSEALFDVAAGRADAGGGALPEPTGDDASPGGAQTAATEAGPPTDTGDDPSTNPELQALNRVLVEAGGLLLPTWGVEISPETRYDYRGAHGLVITDLGGGQTAVAQQVRRDTLENATTLRVGLPWDSQAEVRVPYQFTWEKVSLGGARRESRDGQGFGDVEVALSAQLLRESGLLPDLLGEVRWKTDTGDDGFEVGPDGLATGSGFQAISGALTAVKSYDPLVFFGRLGYTANLPDKKEGMKIDPGDSIGLSLGTVLSAGPGTSLRFGISQSFTDEVSVDGQTIAGTDQVVGMFNFGVSAALPGRTLLDVSAGVGITEDAPDLMLRAALPYRF